MQMPAPVKLETTPPPNLESPDLKKRKLTPPASHSKKPTHKVIKAPGQAIVRTAQACDRCRAKKSRCDGKVPDCSTCLAVGIKCVVSDKLSRKAFPKGYTETLEEYVRQLEAENTKLQGLVHLRDEQLARSSVDLLLVQKLEKDDSLDFGENTLHLLGTSYPSENSEKGSSLPPNAEPRSASFQSVDPLTDFTGNQHNKSCGCSMGHSSVHNEPVSLAGSGPFFPKEEESRVIGSAEAMQSIKTGFLTSGHRSSHDSHIGQLPAPGAFAAASAFEQMHKEIHENEVSKQHLLTNLVATAIPRSTEETLFVPTLLAKVCQAHGYNSAAAKLTAMAIALLKEFEPRAQNLSEDTGRLERLVLSFVMDVEGTKLTAESSFLFLSGLQLPNKVELDHLLNIYFLNWGSVLPVLDKNVFLTNYVRYCEVTANGYLEQKLVHSFELWEKLGALLVLTATMALLSLKSHYLNSPNSAELAMYHDRLSRCNRLICNFIKPNCILTKYCSIESLQILALSLQYCLAIGDVATAYELRGRVITMAQQLRMHRCPAAVLGLSNDQNDAEVQKFMQGERRILFWCVYCLDSYCSLILGLPRLLKDNEIECAMPFSDDSEGTDGKSILVINNTRLTIFGKVTQSALCFMQYCKVLGGIVDSVFSRSRDANDREKAVRQDRILDCWRRDLPPDLKFEIDVDGFSLKTNSSSGKTDWNTYTREQILSIFLYYHAKILVYLPILSKYGNHHNVGLSAKEQLELDQSNKGTVVTSMSMIQQSSLQILELLRFASVEFLYLLPIPINIEREQARFALLVAKGSIDYIKGGVLHQSLKKILSETFSIFKYETNHGMLGALSKNSASLLEHAIDTVMGLKPDLTKSRSRKSVQKKRLKAETPKASEHLLPDPCNLLTSVQSQVLGQVNRNYIDQTNAAHNDILENLNGQLLVLHENQLTQGAYGLIKDPQDQVSNSASSSAELAHEAFDFEKGFSDLFAFDPFKTELNNELMVNEFVADGSLGLFPFISDKTPVIDDDRLSDCIGADGAFSY